MMTKHRAVTTVAEVLRDYDYNHRPRWRRTMWHRRPSPLNYVSAAAEVVGALIAEGLVVSTVEELESLRRSLHESHVARIVAENPGIDEDEVKASVARTNGLPEDYWEIILREAAEALRYSTTGLPVTTRARHETLAKLLDAMAEEAP